MSANNTFKTLKYRAVVQAINSGHVAAETWIYCQAIACGICGGRSGTGTGFSPSSWVFVSTIPQMFHTRIPDSRFI